MFLIFGSTIFNAKKTTQNLKKINTLIYINNTEIEFDKNTHTHCIRKIYTKLFQFNLLRNYQLISVKMYNTIRIYVNKRINLISNLLLC